MRVFRSRRNMNSGSNYSVNKNSADSSESSRHGLNCFSDGSDFCCILDRCTVHCFSDADFGCTVRSVCFAVFCAAENCSCSGFHPENICPRERGVSAELVPAAVCFGSVFCADRRRVFRRSIPRAFCGCRACGVCTCGTVLRRLHCTWRARRTRREARLR